MAIRRHADVNEIMLIIWKNRTKMFLYSPQRHNSSISVSAVALCGCRFSAVTFRASAPTTRAYLWPFCWRSAQKTMKDEAKQMVLVGDRVIFFSKHTFFVALQRGQQTAANLTIRYFPPWPMNLWAKTQNWSTEQGNTRHCRVEGIVYLLPWHYDWKEMPAQQLKSVSSNLFLTNRFFERKLRFSSSSC